MNAQDCILSAEQAARLVYRTASPSPEQVEKIRVKIRRGALRPGPRGSDTTTADAVADYLAGVAVQGQVERRPHTSHIAVQKPLPGLYRELFKDYFLAVLMQRTARRRSRAFSLAVLACQIGLALAPIAIFCGVYRSSAVGLIQSPERVAVERWLDENYHEYGIESLGEPGDDGRRPLTFWYREPGKRRIESERLLTLEEGAVVQAQMPD